LHTAALVASSLGNPVAPLGSLHHANVPPPLMMSFSPVSGFTGHPFPGKVSLAPGGIPGVLRAVSGGIPPASPLPPVAPPVPAAVPPVPVVVPTVVPGVVPTAPAVVPAAPVLIAPVMLAPPVASFVPPPAIFSGVQAKLLKLDTMKDAKAFLDLLEQTISVCRCLNSPQATPTTPCPRMVSIKKPVEHGRGNYASPSKRAVSSSSLRTRVASITAEASK
jgi:hypothetical protein